MKTEIAIGAAIGALVLFLVATETATGRSYTTRAKLWLGIGAKCGGCPQGSTTAKANATTSATTPPVGGAELGLGEFTGSGAVGATTGAVRTGCGCGK